jgi:SOS-response transcriptional repressor LexA
MTEPLTTRQLEVLEHIESCGEMPPTIREITHHFGWKSTTATRDHLRRLQRKGYLLIDPMRARGLRSTRPPELRAPVCRPKPTHTVEWLVPPEHRP